MASVTLIQAGDEAFDWLLGRGIPTLPYRIAPDLAPPEVLEIIRPLPANWMIVRNDEVVGLISLKSQEGDTAEIGYGVARSREGRGIASDAVAEVLELLKDRGLRLIMAETSVDNPASQRVLERSGFQQVGRRIDVEDGALLLWERSLS